MIIWVIVNMIDNDEVLHFFLIKKVSFGAVVVMI